MAVYEFKCPSCGNVFEIKRNIKDMPQEFPCSECDTISPKILSKGSFQFSPFLKELGGTNML